MYALDSDSLFTKQVKRSMLEADLGSLELPYYFLDFNDPYYWNEIELQELDVSILSESLVQNEQLFKRTILTLSDCEVVYANYDRILRMDLTSLDPVEIERVVFPIVSGIALPFATAIILGLIERLDWSKVKSVWAKQASHNWDLLELRRNIVEELVEGELFTPLDSLSDTPFLARTKSDYDGGIEDFVRAQVGKQLSIEELDFIISASEWLFKDIWGDFHDAFRSIMEANCDKLVCITDDDYRFYIWRAYTAE